MLAAHTHTRYDAERAWRLVIAFIDDDDPTALDQIIQQIGDCPECLGAVVRYLGGACSGILLARGGKEFALKAARQMLTEVLESPGPHKPRRWRRSKSSAASPRQQRRRSVRVQAQRILRKLRDALVAQSIQYLGERERRVVVVVHHAVEGFPYHTKPTGMTAAMKPQKIHARSRRHL
jgi:hypothetical protein